jgi:hypothetical protein
MPPQRSLKYRERLELACRIESKGHEMPAYSFYDRNDKLYLVSKEDASRCAKCVCRGGKCDVVGHSSSDWRSLEREE